MGPIQRASRTPRIWFGMLGRLGAPLGGAHAVPTGLAGHFEVMRHQAADAAIEATVDLVPLTFFWK